MKFSDIKEGVRVRESVELLINGETIKVDLRRLDVGEELLVLERARRAAIARGVTDPRDGDPIYDRQLMVYSLAIGIVDPESSKEEPQPFFDSAEQILASRALSTDFVEYAFAKWEHFVEQHTLQKRVLSTADMMRLIASSAGDDAIPFFELSRGMQWHFVRFLAQTLLASQGNKSSPSSPSTTEVSTQPSLPLPSDPVADAEKMAEELLAKEASDGKVSAD